MKAISAGRFIVGNHLLVVLNGFFGVQLEVSLLETFKARVDQELNGYAEGAELPLNRILPATAHASIHDGYRQWNTAPVLTSFLPDKLKG